LRTRRPWLRHAALVILLLALVAAVWKWGLPDGQADPVRQVRSQVEQALPGLLTRMNQMLALPVAAPVERDSLQREVEALEQQARPVWEQLPSELRTELERLLAGRRTLEMRRSQEERAGLAGPQNLTSSLSSSTVGAPPEIFWSSLLEEWNRRVAPASLSEQLALESLVEQVDQVRRGMDRPARLRLDQMEQREPGGAERLAARSLAGSLRQKGVAWSGQGSERQGWADLPDSTVLDVTEKSGRMHVARVVEGRLVFDELPGELQAVSVRLAALELQPKGLRRVLDAGLRLFAPEVYFATLPGSSLPRLNPAAAEARWQQNGDPALKAELARLGQINNDLRRPILARDHPLPGGEADLVDWLRAAAARYEKSQVWPQELELRTPTGRFRVSGCELWHLSHDS
jgi:hypothetical protein